MYKIFWGHSPSAGTYSYIRLNRHTVSVHEGKKLLKCDICDDKNHQSNSCGATYARKTFESPCYFSSCRKEALIKELLIKIPYEIHHNLADNFT